MGYVLGLVSRSSWMNWLENVEIYSYSIGQAWYLIKKCVASSGSAYAFVNAYNAIACYCIGNDRAIADRPGIDPDAATEHIIGVEASIRDREPIHNGIRVVQIETAVGIGRIIAVDKSARLAVETSNRKIVERG